MKKVIFGLATLLFLNACKKECDLSGSDDRIIFGHSYPLCSGDCSVLFQLSDAQLLEDNCDYCPLTDIPFKNDPLSDDKLEIAAPLLKDIPADLLKIDEQRYGCPGCTDGIIYSLEITSGDETHRFYWDRAYEDAPADIKPYLERVVQVIEKL